MEPFDRWRRRGRSAGALYGFGDGPAEPGDHELPSGDYFTAEQMRGFAWKVVGATMAAVGVDRDDVLAYGKLVEPTINEILSEYVITTPERR